MALVVGQKLAGYEILAAVGAGGMGEVYKSRDAKLGRDGAIKVVAAPLDREGDLLRANDSCMLFLSVLGFLDYAGTDNPLAINVVAVLPSSADIESAS